MDQPFPAANPGAASAIGLHHVAVLVLRNYGELVYSFSVRVKKGDFLLVAANQSSSSSSCVLPQLVLLCSIRNKD